MHNMLIYRTEIGAVFLFTTKTIRQPRGFEKVSQ